ncbi:MAG: nitrogen fixation protein NifX [Cyanobacteriota bacterium]|nr:nitrogen fixation protein NifX [Cyanobacteriota bacterium]
MKIAFATNDSVSINAHFGWASQVDVYEVDTDGYTFLETLEFQGDLKEDGNEDKLEPKLKALHDCTIVYVSAIGGSAAARLIRKNITPIKAEPGADEIQDVLARLVETLNGSPPPWLRKALAKSQPSSFDDDLDDNFETTQEEILV